MNTHYLNLAIDGSGIAIITLNRPQVHNAFDEVMINELILVLSQLENMDKIRVILLTAAGESFSAGADLAWMQRMVHYNEAENLADAGLLAQLMQKLYTSTKATIALVQGPAYGGGVGLVACCDFVLASAQAVFCFSEVKMGLIPAVISPYVISAIGERQARRYFMTAESITAEKALMMGLVHEIVEAQQLLETGCQLARQILQNAPQAVKQAKQLIQAIAGQTIDASLIKKTVEKIAAIRISEEAQQRLKAFLQ